MEHPERALEIEEWEALFARGEVPGPLSADEFSELDDVRYGREELLMGWRVSEAFPIHTHQIAMSNLTVLIGLHLIERGLGVILAPAGWILFDEEKRLMLVPDAVVILGDCQPVEAKWMDSPPHLVIEALSPSTARRDRVNKLEWYTKYGVDEYWIVDTKNKYVDVYHLKASSGQPPVRFAEGENIVSGVLPDLALKVEWVFGPLHEKAIPLVFTKSDGTQGHSWPSMSRARRKRKPRYDTDPT
jgi:Uma2 family endonuclease